MSYTSDLYEVNCCTYYCYVCTKCTYFTGMQYQPVRFYKKAILDAELLRNHPQIDVYTYGRHCQVDGGQGARQIRKTTT